MCDLLGFVISEIGFRFLGVFGDFMFGGGLFLFAVFAMGQVPVFGGVKIPKLPYI